jgi:mannose-6-phosphate isomerase-like protein (cupin superfamily)
MSNALIPCAPGRKEFLTRERTFITEQLNDAAVPVVSLAQARVEPGVTTELHSLSVAEWYVIGSGRGMMEVGGQEPFEVRPGDSVEIPAGVTQRIQNIGDEDLILQCVCIPRFTPECYTALE